MPTYKKLSRHRRNAAGYSRLWLAEDHLLLVTSSGYSEEYRRFFFPDIQALIVRRTRWSTGLNWTLGLSSALFGALGFTVPNEGGIVLWSIAGICLIAALINMALGPTCSVQIQTAIAKHPLEPINRLREARKVIAQLAPLIRAVQGDLTPQQIAELTTLAIAPGYIAQPPHAV